MEALVPSILEQKVVGLEARRSYARLVRALGEPAPGPGAPGLRVLPAAGRAGRHALVRVPPSDVERKRADTHPARACSYAARLEETRRPGAGRRPPAPHSPPRRRRVDRGRGGDGGPGRRRCGQRRRLPPAQPGRLAFAGEPRGDDARMLELLEPFRGQRGRVIRLMAPAPAPPPLRPRMPLRSIISCPRRFSRPAAGVAGCGRARGRSAVSGHLETILLRRRPSSL